jgi:hypothetical protein
MYHVCTILWYVLYQAVVLAVPTLGTRRTIGWYERYQPWVHPETRGLIRVIPRTWARKLPACCPPLSAYPIKRRSKAPRLCSLQPFSRNN